MLDPQDESYDRRLAHHLVSLYYQSEEQMEEEFLDMAVLRDFIAYARTYINPRLSEEASQALIEVCVHSVISHAGSDMSEESPDLGRKAADQSEECKFGVCMCLLRPMWT